MKNILVYRSRYQPRYNRKIWVAMFQKHLFRKTWIIKRNLDEIHFFFYRKISYTLKFTWVYDVYREKKKKKEEKNKFPTIHE